MMTESTLQFKSIVMTDETYDYMRGHATPPSDVQSTLIERTHALGASAVMQIPHEQAVLLDMLVKLTGATTVVEVGTYTGYSTLAFAQALPDGGTVITCDISQEWAQLGREAWREANVADRIDLRIGPAVETLSALPEVPHIDMVFLDADKKSYITYWEMLVPRVRPGGLLLVDNVLYYGRAASENATGNAAAIRAFNAHVRADSRVESVMLPISDGLTLARKR